jgi:hypothetical protein
LDRANALALALLSTPPTLEVSMPDAIPAPAPRPAARFFDAAFAAAALAVVVLTALVAIGARTWIDRPFAGFFVRADLSIPAVGRMSWSTVPTRRLFDRTVVAVDGAPIADGDDLHRRVATKPVGSAFAYTITDGTSTEVVTVASRRFSLGDYWAVFGAYLVTGMFYVLLAILAAWALPARRLGRALLVLGSIGGIFMLSAADLYPPGSSLRVHGIATALLPAALIQFGLVVGRTRRRFARAALPVVWAVALAAAASVQLGLGDPVATRWLHTTASVAIGLALASAAVGLIAVRGRRGVETAPFLDSAALFGLGVPAVIFLVAGTLGGVPENASATLAFLFPLGVGGALMQDRLAARALDVARSARSL